MQRWKGRVAVVTGASAGIGAAITQELVDHGVNVVAMARRVDKIEEAVSNARKEAESLGRPHSTTTPGKLYTQQCDVSKEEDILKAFKWVKDNLKGADILVNNAGLAGQTSLSETNTAEWRQIFDVNVLGLSICTREVVQSMRERGVDDGHIIHIGSVCGHTMPERSNPSIYYASKHAVKVLTEGLRKDLTSTKSKIKVSCISPGLVKTDILNSLKGYDPKEIYEQTPHLFASDIAGAVLYVLGTPPHMQVHDMIIKPVGERI